jgi:hypothetical protein
MPSVFRPSETLSRARPAGIASLSALPDSLRGHGLPRDPDQQARTRPSLPMGLVAGFFFTKRTEYGGLLRSSSLVRLEGKFSTCPSE